MPRRPPRSRAARALFPLVLLFPQAACGSSGSFCDRAADYQSADFSAGGNLRERLSDALAALDHLVDAAPDEIVADLIAVRDGVEGFVEGREALDANFDAASGRVSAYLDEHCPSAGGEQQ